MSEMTDLQQKIQNTIAEIVHLDKVAAQLKLTSKELEQAYNEEVLLNKNIDKELKDVERMEGFSTKSIFYKILGSKEEQIEKERQEYLEVILKSEDLINEIKLLEYEENLLRAKIGPRETLEAQLEYLKLKREEEIISKDPVLRRKLLRLSERLEVLFQLEQELNEAIAQGTVSHNLLIQVIQQLSQVRNWGQWPASRREGMRSTMQKRHAIDRARNLTCQVKHHLKLFDNELQDVGQRFEMNVDTSAFNKFSDFFFNNIITDWIVNQQVSAAMGSAKSTQNYVRDLIAILQSRLRETNDSIVSIGAERETIITF